MHKIGILKKVLKTMTGRNGLLANCLTSNLYSKIGINSSTWIELGADCEILKTSDKGWKKGKLKVEITVKFYPDEPEIDALSTSDKQELN